MIFLGINLGPFFFPGENLTLDNLHQLRSYKGFKIVSLNICSLLPKINQLRSEMCFSDLDIFCLCETWLHKDVENQLLSLDDYSLTCADRNFARGGGLCIYTKCDIIFEKLSLTSKSASDLELLGILIKNKSCRNMIIINMYRPPTGNIANAISILDDILNQYTNGHGRLDVLLVGDFNVNTLEESPGKLLLSEF